MISELPQWINILFIVTVVATIWMFYKFNSKPKKLLILVIVWSISQSLLAYFGFYLNLEAIPPRFIVVFFPIALLICYSLFPKNIDSAIENRIIKQSAFIHTIRVPVEITLLYLFLNNMVPELMTFEGRNFDIVAGISAPIIGLLFYKNMIERKALLIWNVISLILVCFILFNGILSAELPFQMFGFEQPNKAILYFPFILLPATIIPIIIWTHVTDIIKLKRELSANRLD